MNKIKAIMLMLAMALAIALGSATPAQAAPEEDKKCGRWEIGCKAGKAIDWGKDQVIQGLLGEKAAAVATCHEQAKTISEQVKEFTFGDRYLGTGAFWGSLMLLFSGIILLGYRLLVRFGRQGQEVKIMGATLVLALATTLLIGRFAVGPHALSTELKGELESYRTTCAEMELPPRTPEWIRETLQNPIKFAASSESSFWKAIKEGVEVAAEEKLVSWRDPYIVDQATGAESPDWLRGFAWVPWLLVLLGSSWGWFKRIPEITQYGGQALALYMLLNWWPEAIRPPSISKVETPSGLMEPPKPTASQPPTTAQATPPLANSTRPAAPDSPPPDSPSGKEPKEDEEDEEPDSEPSAKELARMFPERPSLLRQWMD